MATYQKFECFPIDLAEKKHNCTSDQFVVALVADANTPSVSADCVLADLTEAVYTFCSTRNITTTSGSETGGVYTLALQDLTLTASGGDVGPFRYVVVYNDSAANDELKGMIDYGTDITLETTDTFVIDFSASTMTVI